MDSLLIAAPTLEFEKVAETGKVGNNVDTWPQEVLDLFFEQHSYLADNEVVPVFKQTSDERGFAVGAVMVRKKPITMPKDADASDVIKEIRFPFVIRERSVSSFDVFIVNETFFPATQKNVMQAILRPGVFDIVRTMPGDVSLVNAVYPPYRSRSGIGGTSEFGSDGKTSSVSTSMLDQILPFMSADDLARLKTEIQGDPAIAEQLKTASPLRKVMEKIAAIEALSLEEIQEARRQSIPPDVIQLKRVGRDSIEFKFASSQMYAPQTVKLSIKEAAAVIPAALKAQVMSEGGATVSTDPVVRESFEENKATVIKNTGVYMVKCAPERHEGYESGPDSPTSVSAYARTDKAVVYTSVVDFDMVTMPVSLAVFFDGKWALQDQISGMSCLVDRQEIPEFIKDSMRVRDYLPKGKNDYFPSSNYQRDNSYGKVQREVVAPKLGTVIFSSDSVTTLPVSLISLRVTPAGLVLKGITAMDQALELVPTDGLKKIEKLAEGRYAIPSSLRVIPLGKLCKAEADPAGYVKIGSATLDIISDGHTYTFRRHPSTVKLGSAAEFLTRDEATFLAAAFGMSTQFAEKTLDQAVRVGSVKVAGVRSVTTEKEKLGAVLRREILPLAEKLADLRVLLVKEAAVLPGEDTVDKVLSLNFLTPENVSVFMKNLPAYASATSKLAELLIGARLGLQEVPESAVQRAMTSLQNVVEALQELKYNQPQA